MYSFLWFKIFLYFIYFWLCGIFVAVRASPWLRRGARDLCGCSGFSLAAARGAGSLWLLGLLSGCGVGASHPSDFSCCRAQAPELRLTSSGSQASLLCGKWDLPGTRIKPLLPALAGGFFATEPPGKVKSERCSVVSNLGDPMDSTGLPTSKQFPEIGPEVAADIPKSRTVELDSQQPQELARSKTALMASGNICKSSRRQDP